MHLQQHCQSVYSTFPTPVLDKAARRSWEAAGGAEAPLTLELSGDEKLFLIAGSAAERDRRGCDVEQVGSWCHVLCSPVRPWASP